MEIIKIHINENIPPGYTGIVHWYLGSDFDKTNFIWHVRNGILHRIDGPAMVYPNDGRIYSLDFYLNDEAYSKEEWYELLSEDEKVQALFNADEWNK